MSVIIILGVIVAGIYFQQTENNCKKLAQELDAKITNRGSVGGNTGIVGGKLIKISQLWYYLPSDEEYGKITYTMTFKGIDNEGYLYLRTLSNTSLPYEIEKFYKFNLNNTRLSGMLSGVFIDSELDALKHLPECK